MSCAATYWRTCMIAKGLHIHPNVVLWNCVSFNLDATLVWCGAGGCQLDSYWCCSWSCDSCRWGSIQFVIYDVITTCLALYTWFDIILHHDPDSNFHAGNMGPIWGRQDPGGPHVGPMNIVIWVIMCFRYPVHWNIFVSVIIFWFLVHPL